MEKVKVIILMVILSVSPLYAGNSVISLNTIDFFAEEGKETAAVKISRTNNLDESIEVYIKYSGDIEDDDLINKVSTITLDAGQSEAVVIINPKMDKVSETTESCIVSLMTNAKYDIGLGSAIVYIRDENFVDDGDVAPLSETFKLHSLPGAKHTIYLNFLGGQYYHYHDGMNGSYVTPFDMDNSSSLSDDEKIIIQRIWRAVAEDFLPFNINVTTEEPMDGALTKTSSTDDNWGVSILIGDDPGYGFAWSGSEFWTEYDYPGYASINNPSGGYYDIGTISQAICHEVGHTMGLRHHGVPSDDYYDGHDAGGYRWVPNMGRAWNALNQWSKGEYPNANNTGQDDLAIISNSQNGFGYRVDDHANDNKYSTDLVKLDDGYGTLFGQGIIERNTDIDWFKFDHNGGDLVMNILPGPQNPNLDIGCKLYDSKMNLIEVSDKVANLSAAFAVNLTSGTYYLSVEGVGSNEGLGYSDYGSLGEYLISSGTGIIAQYEPNGESASSAIQGYTQFPSLEISNLTATNLGSATYSGSWALYWADNNDQYFGFQVKAPKDLNVLYEKLKVSFYSFGPAKLKIKSSQDNFTSAIDSIDLLANKHNVVEFDMNSMTSTNETVSFRLYMNSNAGWHYLTGPKYPFDNLGIGVIATGRVFSTVKNDLNDPAQELFIIYPNPTDSKVYLSRQYSYAKVYDFFGKEIAEITPLNNDISTLSSSVYYLKIYNQFNKLIGTSKVIKN